MNTNPEDRREALAQHNVQTMGHLFRFTQQFNQTFAAWHNPDGTTKVQFYQKVQFDPKSRTSSEVFAPGAAALIKEGFYAFGFAHSADGIEWEFLCHSQHELPLLEGLLQKAVDDRAAASSAAEISVPDPATPKT